MGIFTVLAYGALLAMLIMLAGICLIAFFPDDDDNWRGW